MTDDPAALNARLQQAVALHQGGQLAEAEAHYRAVLAQAPQQFDALHLLGVVRRQRGDPAQAVTLIEQALALRPGQAIAHCNLGVALQDLGHSSAALASFDRALALKGDYALAWSNRGNALRQLARLDQALASYARAVQLQPRYAEAWCHHATTLFELGQPAAALASCERALAARRPYPQACCVRANALFQLHQHEAALLAYDEALAGDAAMPQAHAGRSLSLQKLGRLDAALASSEAALALQPGQAQRHQQRGDVLRALGRAQQAIGSYQAARALARSAGQDTAELDFLLAALGAQPAPGHAPAAYVSTLFDAYADHFDAHLTDVLEYRTPALLAALLARHVRASALACVDLGCGTGLCAPFLRPLAATLAGVDLSPRMLERAAQRGLYDELECADIGAFLASRPAAFDLLLAADVLVYIGDLACLFGQARAALRAGGWFCFSTELATDAPQGEAAGFSLQPSQRYAHAAGYIAQLAARHGFDLLEAAPANLRREHGQAIVGQLVLLRVRS